MSNVRLGSGVKWLHARSVENDVEDKAGIAPESVLRHDGEWGEITGIERVYHPIEVLGLAAPDAAGATATATFTFSVKRDAGLKLKLGIATLGVSASYTVEEGLELEGTSGEATIASFLLPLDLLTQLFRPAGATEWFERSRYQLIMFDPSAPNIGARADVVPKDRLLERKQSPGTRVGGGSATVSHRTATTRELAISAEIALPLSTSEKGPGLALSASITGSVAIEVASQLPANTAYQQYWLAPIAGACFEPA